MRRPTAPTLWLAALVALAGCRLDASAPAPEATAPEATPDAPTSAGLGVEATEPERSADDAGLAVEGPPVVAGDTARVTPDLAGRADRPADLGVEVGGGGLAVPVAGVAPGDLVDTFEAARSEGRTHNAIDILAPRGTPVVAVAPGEVLRLFTSDKGGLTVYQLADDGRTVYYYAHLDAYAPGLRAGQRLRRGDRVGTVGDSGNAAPGNTHLHFAIWRSPGRDDFWDGEPVNPYPLLSR